MKSTKPCCSWLEISMVMLLTIILGVALYLTFHTLPVGRMYSPMGVSRSVSSSLPVSPTSVQGGALQRSLQGGALQQGALQQGSPTRPVAFRPIVISERASLSDTKRSTRMAHKASLAELIPIELD